jgi:hypothetical protein
MDDIDYKALYEQVVGENERLKISMLKMNNVSSLSFDAHTMNSVRSFVEENYIVIFLAMMLVYYLLTLTIEGISTVRSWTHE